MTIIGMVYLLKKCIYSAPKILFNFIKKFSKIKFLYVYNMDFVWSCSLCELFKKKPKPTKHINHHSEPYQKKHLQLKKKYEKYKIIYMKLK